MSMVLCRLLIVFICMVPLTLFHKGRHKDSTQRAHQKKLLEPLPHLDVPYIMVFLVLTKFPQLPGNTLVSFRKGLGDIQISYWEVLLSTLCTLEWKNRWISKGTSHSQWLPKGLNVDLSVLLAEPGLLLTLTHTTLSTQTGGNCTV